MEEISQAEFRERFVKTFLSGVPQEARKRMRSYAEQAADALWGEEDYRKQGPEVCAQNELEYIGEE